MAADAAKATPRRTIGARCLIRRGMVPASADRRRERPADLKVFRWLADIRNMPRLKRWCPYALIAIASAWLASLSGHPADWNADAAPSVEALADGRVGEYLTSEALMGPFATLVQAPFV